MENNRLQQLKEKVLLLSKTNKWVLVPLILLFFFLVFLVSLLFQPQTQPEKITPTPTIIETQPTSQTPSLTEQQEQERFVEEEEEEISEEDLLTWRGFQGRETLPDGTVRYNLTRDNPNRPATVILSPEKKLLFRREVATKEFPLPALSYIKDTYGEPDNIRSGSSVYGERAVLYFYKNGAVYIGNPQTDEIYEYQLFPGMSFEEYQQKFGNQN